MGYILPYIPIQQMQYANRMEKPKRGIPIVPNVPPVQNERINQELINKKSQLMIDHHQKTFHLLLSELEGKGLVINETI